MRMRVLLATNNPGKVREYREILGDLPIELVTPAEIGLSIEVPESGSTYEENAVLKARAFAQASGLVALADDSGLEVDVLGGAPGVQSHRYDGGRGSDAHRYRLLLAQLEGVPLEQRTARFRCVIAIATPSGLTHTCEGVCPGVILTEPRGEGGFGYDPVFWLPEMRRTMAELGLEEKNQVSHRGRAGRKAREILLRLLTGSTDE
jgi:XTP/dITP diphosphohydrolase